MVSLSLQRITLIRGRGGSARARSPLAPASQNPPDISKTALLWIAQATPFAAPEQELLRSTDMQLPLFFQLPN